MKLRHVLFETDPKYKKYKKYAEDESEVDDDWIASHEEELKAKEIEKVEKKFTKENEKLEEDGKKPQKDSVLKDRIDAIEEEYERLTKERGTKKAALKRDRSAEKIEEAIDKLDEKIKAYKLQIVDRDAGKEVALGTRSVFVYLDMYLPMLISSPSKINYLDPRYLISCSSSLHILTVVSRITAAWCKTHDVPIEKLFSKTLVTKCKLFPRDLSTICSWLFLQFLGLWRSTRTGNFSLVFRAPQDVGFLSHVHGHLIDMFILHC